ncbi:MAG: hypothetical protein L7U61_05615 [Flavobacteriaceae bacterium]|nr:hypothetical protein [Flavobacteriaceae bacterium]
MKTLLVTTMLFLGFATMAQPPRGDKGPEHRPERMKHLTAEQQATLMTKKMTLDLDLNEDQQSQIYALIIEKTKKHEQRKANKPKERPSKDELYEIKLELMDEQIAMKKAMKSILNASQFETWTSIQKKEGEMKRRKKHQNKRK